jgi:hypothetical protein
VNKPSVRFTISRHNSFADITAMIDSLAAIAGHGRASDGIRSAG